MKEIATNIFWIETSSELVEFCQKIAHAKVLALDTEFMRTTTFWPEPCLIQVGNGEYSALIDPKAKNLDWTPFIALMEDHSITKVLHSGRQDMEIFYRLWKIFPFPLFDTQVAATMCGHDDNISYENLVQHTLGIALDKAQQFSNWNRRPLSHRQLLYAAADVVHLPDLYASLKERIGTRYDWVQEDLQPLYDPHLYSPLPEKAWQRFKPGRPQSLKFTKVMHKLCAWREELAQRKDIARRRVLKDGILLELAQRRPATIEELKAIPFAAEIAEGYYETILELIKTALAQDLAERPIRHRRIKEEDIEALKVLAAEVATAEDIPLRVLATRRDLEALAAHDPKARCLQGWRREIFGVPALKLLEDLEAAAKEAKLKAAEETIP
jgi:ribonuclease D